MASGRPWFAKNYALTPLCWTKDCSVANRYWAMQLTSLDGAMTPACVLCRQDWRNALHGKAFLRGI